MSIRRKVTAIAGVAVLALPAGVSAANATSNSSQDITIYQIRHDQSGRCLDASASQGVTLKACNGSEYQQWEPDGRSWANIAMGNVCLDGSPSQGVRAIRCNGSVYQTWSYWKEAKWFAIGSMDYCLAGSVTQGPKMEPCPVGGPANPYQRWTKTLVS